MIEVADQTPLEGLRVGTTFIRGDVGKGSADGVEETSPRGSGEESVAEAVQASRGDLTSIENDVAG